MEALTRNQLDTFLFFFFSSPSSIKVAIRLTKIGRKAVSVLETWGAQKGQAADSYWFVRHGWSKLSPQGQFICYLIPFPIKYVWKLGPCLLPQAHFHQHIFMVSLLPNLPGQRETGAGPLRRPLYWAMSPAATGHHLISWSPINQIRLSLHGSWL